MTRNNNMKKWAIYKTEYGLYARRYIDTVRDLKTTHLYGIVKPQFLPITLNRGLGYSSFNLEYEQKNCFIKIVKSEEYPLKRNDMFPKNSELFFYGWIDTEGNTYTCGFEDHSYAAEFLCEELGITNSNAEKQLEQMGWIKISRDVPYTPDNLKSQVPYATTQTITQAQYKTLCDIGLDNHWLVESWFLESEPTW